MHAACALTPAPRAPTLTPRRLRPASSASLLLTAGARRAAASNPSLLVAVVASTPARAAMAPAAAMGAKDKQVRERKEWARLEEQGCLPREKSHIRAFCFLIILFSSLPPAPFFPPPLTHQPFIIIGGGRVGGALAAMGETDVSHESGVGRRRGVRPLSLARSPPLSRAGRGLGQGALSLPLPLTPIPLPFPPFQVTVRRGEPIPATPAGPIVVATRNDALAGVVEATPKARRPDLVFLQNGHLQPWLDAAGLGEATQVLVYFAVAAAGDAPTDGVTDANPEGLTAATGKWAPALAARLATAGLTCKVLPKGEFDKAMLEKLVWIRSVEWKRGVRGTCLLP